MHMCSVQKNSAVRKSFDELINARRFNSVILSRRKCARGQRSKRVHLQITLLCSLLESERIKEKIRNLEHDMWSW